MTDQREDSTEGCETYQRIERLFDGEWEDVTPQDSPEARIARYDLVTNYRCGASIEEMERNDESGEWVRWEDVESRLYEQAQEIERLKAALSQTGERWRLEYERAEKAQAEIERLKATAHEQCHDISCNSGRTGPRGASGIGCSCSGRDAAYAELREAQAEIVTLKAALERTTAMCRAATTWAPDDTQGLRYHALEAAKDGMAALAELTQDYVSPGRDTA